MSRPARRPRSRAAVTALTSRAATRAAFVVITAFVLVQAVWWAWFQHRYIGEVVEERLAAWERDARTATLALERSGGAAEVRETLQLEHPHLRPLPGGGFEVDPVARGAFVREQTGYQRMFAYEGPFFVLVILALLGFIGRSLRAERELKRRQQNFLSAVTHEFKTPISGLRLLIETAQRRTLTPEKRAEYLRRMQGELSRLEATSEQVLASARLEQGGPAPVLDRHDLARVAERTVERARGGLEARGASVRFTAPPGPLPVSIDPDALSLALGNLLDNAVKYSPGPERPVTVRLERDGDLALLHVEDEGIGVSDADRDRVFERFWRAGDEMTRGARGVGLGLHLVRTAVEAMHGWVRLEPNRRAGRGTRFTIVLPLRVEAEPPVPDPATDPSPDPARPDPAGGAPR